jgi:hypothetical protein
VSVRKLNEAGTQNGLIGNVPHPAGKQTWFTSFART